jgi:hypothetical protein
MGEATASAGAGIDQSDVQYLRELARRVAEIGNDPVQKQKAQRWTRHNDLERVRPMVLTFPEGAWRELLPGSELRVTDPFLRGVEWDLLHRIYCWEHIQDDNVIEPTIVSHIVMRSTGWGIEEHRTRPTEATGAFHIDPVIHSEADVDRMQIPRLIVDGDETERIHAILQNLFGDILTVEKRGRCGWGTAPLDFYAQLRGIDNLYIDLFDNPEMVHKAVDKIVDGDIQMMKDAEEQNVLSLGNRNHYAGSGGTCYTTQLPQEGYDPAHVRIRDLWGSATAQIFSEVSPAMHTEFALMHEKRFSDLFGLNCYGCCEPLHDKLDAIIEHIPRLRRVSISPWADVDISSERLGDKYIFSYKPNPAALAGEQWQSDVIRKDLVSFCEKTRGNIVEIIMKDTHTIRSDPRRMWEWVKIAREVAEEFAY